MTVWRRVGLHRIAPLTFDAPIDTTTPPYAAAKASVRDYTRYAGGRVNKIQIDVTIRLTEGDTSRRLIEERVNRMAKIGRATAGISDFRETRASIDRDQARFAGKAVEMAPRAWELWIDEVTTGN